MQFVRMELCKMYKNRYKYSKNGSNDWECVVKSAIKRRVIDFRGRMLKTDSRFISENRLSSDDNEYKVEARKSQEPEVCKNSEVINFISNYIRESEDFDSWDLEFFETVNFMNETDDKNKEFDDDKIRYMMGYEKSESDDFNERVHNFRSKIKLLIGDTV